MVFVRGGEGKEWDMFLLESIFFTLSKNDLVTCTSKPLLRFLLDR